ncbi:MAG: hypothetical protein D6711_12070 [Chloroflexi bacterium]|nr:MAG: hypothetical protein D6711_12070 [Chloroflexota bacterium]
MFSSTGIAYARGMLNGELCHIDAETIIEGDLFVFCGELTIAGRVEGSVLGGARIAVITGHVEGSIYLFGGELDVSGTIGKDIHYAGLIMNVEPTVTFEHERGSIISANFSNTIHSGSVVPGNITNLGYQLVVDGIVGGELNFWGSALDISGSVGEDVFATVGNAESTGTSSQIETLLIPFFDVELNDPGLVITETGTITGTLDYTGPTAGMIQGEVKEGVIYTSTTPELGGTPVQQSARSLQRYLGVVLREFTSLAFIGVLCVSFIPRYMQTPVRLLQMRPLSSLGIGLLSFILSFPIVVIIAVISLILILLLSLLPLDNVVLFSGIVLGLANIGGASIFYFTAIYITRVVVALALGRFLLRVLIRQRLILEESSWRYLALSMAFGVVLLSILGAIPVIGWGFNALALFLGLGAILSALRMQYRKLRNNTPPPRTPMTMTRFTPDMMPQLPYLPEQARQFAPPLIDESPGLDGPGMDNLPEGFNWWGEND